ncbi:hypothetical protein IQ252_20770 [Tychonema sp. LEGE 07203]|nr:hypothetical protein [Tychonema sp. LEGE 07203]
MQLRQTKKPHSQRKSTLSSKLCVQAFACCCAKTVETSIDAPQPKNRGLTDRPKCVD